MPVEEADALMAALASGWVRGPGIFDTKAKASAQAHSAKLRLVNAQRIRSIEELETRHVELPGGKFAFVLGRKLPSAKTDDGEPPAAG